MTTSIQKQINSNVEYTIKATEASYRGKYFVVVRGDMIQSFHKTKRGAEGSIKKNSFSYYDEYSHEMVNAGTGLEIVELSSFDIVDYYNTPEIWFTTMFNRWKINQHNDYMMTQAKELECSENVINAIQSILDNTVNGKSFPSLEMVGLSDAIETAEEVQETPVQEKEVSPEVETVNVQDQETNNTVTMKLNEEKNGVELYFSEKPSEEVRNELKVNGFRWSRFNKAWYSKQNDGSLALAEKLSNSVSKENTEETSEPVTIDLVEFVDVTQFTISEETEKRLIDTAFININKKVGRETDSLQSTLTNLMELTIDAISYSNNNYYSNKLIEGFNAFCERYTREQNSYLYKRSLSPSWMTTGRSGLNITKYNKNQDQLTKKMMALVEMVDKQKSIIAKYKYKFKQEKVKAVQKQVANMDASSYNFTTKTIEFTGGNYKTSKRVYVLDNYFITKYAGTFRIYDMQTQKEVYSMKTTEKLEDAKKYVVYLLQSVA